MSFEQAHLFHKLGENYRGVPNCGAQVHGVRVLLQAEDRPALPGVRSKYLTILIFPAELTCFDMEGYENFVTAPAILERFR